jgi:hypothetical protein
VEGWRKDRRDKDLQKGGTALRPDERSMMEKHFAYWSDNAKLGTAIVEQDPAKGLLRKKYYPMPRAIVGTLRI